MMLAAGPGTIVTVRASGREALDAIDAVCTLVESGFGEED
jgi:phosphocarrier protein